MSQHNQTHDRTHVETEDVLEFWFGTMTDGVCSAATRRRWFAADPAFDREITERFAPLLEGAAGGALSHWLAEARGRLAFIIVTDQFSRQIHRGLREAFETDKLAVAAARDGIDLRHDRLLSIDERSFFYMPFKHSESLVDQHTSVELFTQLADETRPAHRAVADNALRYALNHRDIVDRFGRFPHRNECLGRASTDAEVAFLRDASRFGQ